MEEFETSDFFWIKRDDRDCVEKATHLSITEVIALVGRVKRWQKKRDHFLHEEETFHVRVGVSPHGDEYDNFHNTSKGEPRFRKAYSLIVFDGDFVIAEYADKREDGPAERAHKWLIGEHEQAKIRHRDKSVIGRNAKLKELANDIRQKHRLEEHDLLRIDPEPPPSDQKQ